MRSNVHCLDSSGAEAIIHALQQTVIQKPTFDLFSADAVKAFYNLNRDLALKKLKVTCPEVYNMFLDKYNGHSNVFFNDLIQGVIKMRQEEGGSPGAPEMSLLYELGVCEFVDNVANLLRQDSLTDPSQDGLIMGYIDDI